MKNIFVLLVAAFLGNSSQAWAKKSSGKIRHVPVGVAAPNSGTAVLINPGAIPVEKGWALGVEAAPGILGQPNHSLLASMSGGMGVVGASVSATQSIGNVVTTDLYAGLAVQFLEKVRVGASTFVPMGGQSWEVQTFTAAIRVGSDPGFAVSLLWKEIVSDLNKSRLSLGLSLTKPKGIEFGFELTSPNLGDLHGLTERYRLGLSSAIRFTDELAIFGSFSYPLLLEWDIQLPSWKVGAVVWVASSTSLTVSYDRENAVRAFLLAAF